MERIADVSALSKSYRRVFDLLILEGLSEKQIAARLNRSIHTVHGTVKGIYRKMGVESHRQLAARIVRQLLSREGSAHQKTHVDSFYAALRESVSESAEVDLSKIHLRRLKRTIYD